MKRSSFFSAILGPFGVALAQTTDVLDVLETHPKNAKKFYITGLAHTDTANDCTIPPIVCYGTSRINALLNCCEGGGLTVWTEEEWQDFRRRSGKEFDAFCKSDKTMAKTTHP